MSLREDLTPLLERDQRLRKEHLAFLTPAYDSVRAIHQQIADRVTRYVREHGWPDDPPLTNIVYHLADYPQLQRAMLPHLREQFKAGRIEGWQLARLEDSVRTLEGRPQRYGTHFDWDESGEMSPVPAIEEPASVDERRAALGLPKLEDELHGRREFVKRTGTKTPADLSKRRASLETFARMSGWRT
jgi:uncharacterized protein DUF6624